MNSLAVVLRLAESVPETPENFRALRELVQTLTNMLNQFEKDEDD